MSKTAIHAMTRVPRRGVGHLTELSQCRCAGQVSNAGALGNAFGPAMRARAPDDAAGNPEGRVGEMHEIANLAVFFNVPGAEYLTGQTIAIDGSAFQSAGANFQHFGPSDDQWRAAREAVGAANERDKALRATGKDRLGPGDVSSLDTAVGTPRNKK